LSTGYMAAVVGQGMALKISKTLTTEITDSAACYKEYAVYLKTDYCEY
jgi:hypothetical protein